MTPTNIVVDTNTTTAEDEEDVVEEEEKAEDEEAPANAAYSAYVKLIVSKCERRIVVVVVQTY